MATYTIGTGGTYSTIPDAWAATPSTWTEDNTFEFTSNVTVSSSVDLTGKTTGSHKMIWRPSTSEAFNDHADKITNPVRVDDTKGTTITFSAASRFLNFDGGTVHCEFHDLQFHLSHADSRMFRNPAGTILFSQCILRLDGLEFGQVMGGTFSGNVTMEACAVYTPGTASAVVVTMDSTAITFAAKNCTFWQAAAGSGSRLISITGSSAATIYNSAMFNFPAIEASASPSGSHNATDLSTPGWGTSWQASLTVSNQLENVSSTANFDARAKAGGALIANGTAGQTPAADIVGTAWASPPCIGCWQYASAAGTGTRRRVVFI